MAFDNQMPQRGIGRQPKVDAPGAYLGCAFGNGNNANGVVSDVMLSQGRNGHNRVAVGMFGGTVTQGKTEQQAQCLASRTDRSSQPWALRQNPVGIPKPGFRRELWLRAFQNTAVGDFALGLIEHIGRVPRLRDEDCSTFAKTSAERHVADRCWACSDLCSATSCRFNDFSSARRAGA